eukprot:9472610-Pyramimonas_sp.AAC.2
MPFRGKSEDGTLHVRSMMPDLFRQLVDKFLLSNDFGLLGMISDSGLQDGAFMKSFAVQIFACYEFVKEQNVPDFNVARELYAKQVGKMTAQQISKQCEGKKLSWPNLLVFPAERPTQEKKLIEQFRLDHSSQVLASEMMAESDGSVAALVSRIRESIVPKKIVAASPKKRKQMTDGDGGVEIDPEEPVADAYRTAMKDEIKLAVGTTLQTSQEIVESKAAPDHGDAPTTTTALVVAPTLAEDRNAKYDFSSSDLIKKLLSNLLGSVFLQSHASGEHLSSLGDAYLTLASDKSGGVKATDIFQKSDAATEFELWGRVVSREVAVNINVAHLVHLGDCHGVDLYLTPLGQMVYGKADTCYAWMIKPVKLPVVPKAKAKGKAGKAKPKPPPTRPPTLEKATHRIEVTPLEFVLTVSGQKVVFQFSQPRLAKIPGVSVEDIPLRRERVSVDEGITDSATRPSKKQKIVSGPTSTSLVFAGK